MRFYQAAFVVAIIAIMVGGAVGAESIDFPRQPAVFILDKSKRDTPYRSAHLDGLKDGDVLKNPIRLEFRAYHIKIAPAGDMMPGSGHFHLLIDTALTLEEMAFAIPTSERHIHYGKGQTEATITLPPGKHTLQLVMGDGLHVPHKPPIMSKPVTVTVE